MMMTDSLPAAWQQWLAENVARGCAPQSLIDDMVRNGFDPDFARAMVLQRINAGGTSAADQAAPFHRVDTLANANLIRTSDRDVQVQMRLTQARVALLGNVLSDEECNELKSRAMTRMSRSTIVDPSGGAETVIPNRSSEGTYFEREADSFIARLDRRLAQVMGVPVSHGEGLQVLHYGAGGEYRPHYDYFPPDDPGSSAHLARGGQRIASLVIYLDCTESGGATIFPRLGLEVVPQKGSAVYFSYCDERGRLDPLSLHGGAPVLSGSKWIATKWVRQRTYA